MIKCIFKIYGFSSFHCGESPLDWINTGLGAIGIGSNAYSQYDANATNLQSVRETNEMNYLIHKEDKQAQIDMFNRTNAYNTPEQQVARLRAAGINPSAVLGSDGQRSGVSAVMPSVPAAPQMVAGHVNPVDFSPSLKLLQDSVSQMFQNQNIDLQNQEQRFKLLHMEEQYQLDMRYKIAEIDEKIANKNLSQEQRNKLIAERNSIEQAIELHELIKDDLVKKFRLDNDMVQEETYKVREEKEGLRLQNEYQHTLNQWLPKMQQAQIDSFKAATASAYADAGLKKQMTKTEKENTVRAVTERQIAALRRAHVVVEQDMEDDLKRANLAYIEAATRKARNTDNFIQNYSPLASFGTGVSSVFRAIK